MTKPHQRQQQPADNNSYKMYLLLLLAIVGGMLGVAFRNNNPSEGNSIASNWADKFEILQGDLKSADLFIVGNNHDNEDDSWRLVEDFAGEDPITVLVEGIPLGKEMSCKDRMKTYKSKSSSFKPICIGWDIKDPSYHKEVVKRRVNEDITFKLREFYFNYEQSVYSEKDFSDYVKNVLSKSQEVKESLEREHHFTQANIKNPKEFTFVESNYMTCVEMIKKFTIMQEQLNKGKTFPQVFEGYISRFPSSAENYNRWEKEQSDEILERNKNMIEAVHQYAKPGKKTAVLAGTAHVFPIIEMAKPGVNHLYKALKDPSLKNRHVIFVPKQDMKRYKSSYRQ